MEINKSKLLLFLFGLFYVILKIMRLSELKDKKIVILGFGREGQDALLALKKLFPQQKLAVADKTRPKQWPKFKGRAVACFGPNYLKKVKLYQVVIKTPGIPLSAVRPYLKKKANLTSQTKIFFDNFPGLIIGVTGTKGKGTTASLIYVILKEAGLKAQLVGNIGQPVMQKLVKLQQKKNKGADEIFVYELSSHQLQGLKKSPQIAVLTNLFPDHLDYYPSLKAYFKAKESIIKYQTSNGFVVYNAKDKKVKALAQKSNGQKIAVKKPCWRYPTILKGDFNGLNIALAVETAKLLGASEKAIKQGIKKFKGLAERLEYLGAFQGIEFYSDSMSTLPEAAMAALQTLQNKVETLIIGGYDKGSDYQKLAEVISQSKIKNLIILGQGTGQKIWQGIVRRKTSRPKKFVVQTMKKAVQIAFEKTSQGKICLLSPASASFNLFKDYKERGSLFKKWVKYYGKNTKKS